ncbi:MAG: hypothetical protein EB165_07685 [Euryarchaeota archaeon]|nr:hypothetical protein [Euryarchaeota archaeon]
MSLHPVISCIYVVREGGSGISFFFRHNKVETLIVGLRIGPVKNHGKKKPRLAEPVRVIGSIMGEEGGTTAHS